MTRNIINILFSLALVSFLMVTVTAPSARAATISTSDYLKLHNDSMYMEVVSFLSREDVQNQLVRLGVSSDEARKRVAALTEEELMQLHYNIDNLPAGSDGFAVLGVVLVVLIVLELVGVTNVFTRL